MSPNYVPGIGSISPQLMIVGEAPGKQEDEQLQPFVGPSGAMLDEFLATAKIKRSDCYITNVVKYRPPMNDLSKLHLIDVDLNRCIAELWENEINVLRPNCILAVGDTALNALTGNTGILNYRGSILLANDGKTKVVPTVHPAALLREGEKGALPYVYTKLIQADICRAVEESISSRLELPDRQLDIAHNSLDLFRYFREYQSLDKAAMDIESINCIPVCVGFAFNRHHAISVPLLRKIGNNLLTDMGEREIVECWRIIDKQLRRLKLVGHNLKYDEFKLSLCGFRCPNIHSDTLIKTRVIFPELPDKGLNVVSSLWTREPYYKSEGKEFKLGKVKFDQLLKYNAKDCAVEIEVDEEQDKDLDDLSARFKVPLRSYYYDYMMKKHKFYLNMENRGFKVDLPRQKELRKKYTEMQEEVHARLVEAIGYEVNVKSYPQVYELLYKAMRFKPMKRDPTSEDTIVALLANHAKTKEKVKILTDLLEERRIRDQKSRYINFCPDYDGRCKSSFNIIATETCRSSTSILKKPVRPKKIGLAFHTISKHGRLAKDIRSMFVVDEGKVFIQADGSQLQARVVAVLAEDWELLAAFDTVDIHRRTAGLAFGLISHLDLRPGFIPRVDDLPKDGPERFTGKKLRHAGNFDMKKRRYMTEFNTEAQKAEIPMNISEWKAGQMLDLFHAASPKLKGVFHRDIQDALNNSRVLIDPFGGVRVFNGRLDDELYKEGYANIPQRTEAHLIQGAALAVEEELNGDLEGVFVSENHDSLLMQVPASNWQPYAKLMKKHMERPIDFNIYCTLKRDYKLVIPADIELSDSNYGDIRKVKLDDERAKTA